MPSYFRKMINFASSSSSSSSSGNSTPKQSTTDTPSFNSSPNKVSFPSPPQSPPSLPLYQYGPPTPKVISSELKSSWNSSPRSGWGVKQRQAAFDGMQIALLPTRVDELFRLVVRDRIFFIIVLRFLLRFPLFLEVLMCQQEVVVCYEGFSEKLADGPGQVHNPRKPQAVHMHPLFALNRSSRKSTATAPAANASAPIQYDVSSTPATNNTTDYLNQRIPMCTLLEPATEPPTRGKLTLASDEFPWPVVVHASGNSAPVDKTGRPIVPPASPSGSQGRGELADASPVSSPAMRSVTSSSCSLPRNGGSKLEKKFYIDSSADSDDEDDEEEDDDDEATSDAFVSNLDVLCAIHSTLATGICQDEWDQLGEGDSPEQRRIARAYRRRCRETGDDLMAGVKRIDFLKNKTVLVGIESRKRGDPTSRDGVLGKLVFAEGK
ncbi:hypothetical protein MD484_g8047, partial [Candolleomyces efflorescens]